MQNVVFQYFLCCQEYLLQILELFLTKFSGVEGLMAKIQGIFLAKAAYIRQTKCTNSHETNIF